TRALAAGDSARAVALLKNVVEDGKDRPVQGKARLLLQDLEQQAASRLAQARTQADKGQTSEAVEGLSRLTKQYVGTPAAREAAQLVATLASRSSEAGDGHRARRARELLSQAREDYRMQQFSCCLDRCEL